MTMDFRCTNQRPESARDFSLVSGGVGFPRRLDEHVADVRRVRLESIWTLTLLPQCSHNPTGQAIAWSY